MSSTRDDVLQLARDEVFIQTTDVEDIPALLNALHGLTTRLMSRFISEKAKSPVGRLMTVEETAEALGVSVDWIYRNGEKLGAVKLGSRTTRIPSRRLERFIRERS